MIVPGFILRWLCKWAAGVMATRKPDIVIEKEGVPGLERWYIWGQKPESEQTYSHNADVPFYLYLHRFLRDDERPPHDHPRHNISLVLSSGYWEWIKGGYKWRKPGRLVFRHASTPHRIEMVRDMPAPVSLFFGGPKVREWGFQTERGWVHWDEYYAQKE